MNKFFTMGAALLAGMTLSQADITINVNSGNFLDEYSQAMNNMQVAIVVDTTGNGFSAGLYDGFDFTINEQYLTVDSQSTDDLYIFSDSGISLTMNSPMFGDGSLAAILDIPTDMLTSGQSFALIWFSNNGANAGMHYGIVEHENFVVPGNIENGITTAPYPFNSLNPGAANYVLVPEPSITALAMVLGAGAIAILRRRRRKVLSA